MNQKRPTFFGDFRKSVGIEVKVRNIFRPQGPPSHISRNMKNLLASLVSAALLAAQASSAEPRVVPAAHTVALNALHDAVEIAIEGAAAIEYTKPVIPIHVTIKEQKTISEIRDFLVGAHFGATDKIHP